MSVAISVDHLAKAFPNGRGVHDVTFDVEAGHIFGFLGPNGAGKTTTIRLMLGLLAPDAGRARVAGHDVEEAPAAVRAASGVLLDADGLYGRLTANENLEFSGGLFGMTRVDVVARSRELLQAVDLWDRRMELVQVYSRGMRQRLAIVRALLHRPRVLFLDEPTTGLDPVAAAALRASIASLAAHDGITVFLTTHNLHEAQAVCDDVAILRAGRIVAQGPPDQVASGEMRRETVEIRGTGLTIEHAALLARLPSVTEAVLDEGTLRITLLPGADAAPVVAAAVHGGIPVAEVHRVVPTLEAAFLSLMEEAR